MKPITASWGMVDEYPISSSIAVFWSYKNHENHMGLPGALSDSHQEQTSFSCSSPEDHILGTHGAATVNGSVLIHVVDVGFQNQAWVPMSCPKKSMVVNGTNSGSHFRGPFGGLYSHIGS